MYEDECKGCKYHDEFTAVCANIDSIHVADFWHSGCALKEVDDDKRVSNGRRMENDT